MRVWSLLLLLFLSASFVYGETDEQLLSRLRDAILKRFNEIHYKQTKEPKGVWYANQLATLLNERGMSLLPEDWTGYCNPYDFTKINIRIFKLNAGVPATGALENVVKGLSILDCGNATQLVYYLAISDVVGRQAFDSYVASSAKPLYISVYTDQSPQDSIFFDFMNEVTIPSPSVENKRPVTLGQLVYFRNYLSYSKRHPTGHAQGFNTIYVGKSQKGDQMYIAFWNDRPKTEGEIIAFLKKRYFEPLDLWDQRYFWQFPAREVYTEIDPNHQFFDDRKVYSYIFNLSLIKQLIKFIYADSR